MENETIQAPALQDIVTELEKRLSEDNLGDVTALLIGATVLLFNRVVELEKR